MSTLPEINARAAAPALDGDRAAVLAWLDDEGPCPGRRLSKRACLVRMG